MNVYEGIEEEEKKGIIAYKDHFVKVIIFRSFNR